MHIEIIYKEGIIYIERWLVVSFNPPDWNGTWYAATISASVHLVDTFHDRNDFTGWGFWDLSSQKEFVQYPVDLK